jgi:hypothetical protein
MLSSLLLLLLSVLLFIIVMLEGGLGEPTAAGEDAAMVVCFVDVIGRTRG